MGGERRQGHSEATVSHNLCQLLTYIRFSKVFKRFPKFSNVSFCFQMFSNVFEVLTLSEAGGGGGGGGAGAGAGAWAWAGSAGKAIMKRQYHIISANYQQYTWFSNVFKSFPTFSNVSFGFQMFSNVSEVLSLSEAGGGGGGGGAGAGAGAWAWAGSAGKAILKRQYHTISANYQNIQGFQKSSKVFQCFPKFPFGFPMFSNVFELLTLSEAGGGGGGGAGAWARAWAGGADKAILKRESVP